ncbi:MAG: endolytic transglycosylase MltG [Promicromonosporaceae bacterium]|nr:endolytic transglycosylase MltG [Promicromonosporaceae bacterium]
MTDIFDHPAVQQPYAPPGRRSAARARAAVKRRRRRRARATVVILVVLVLAGGVAVTTWDHMSGLFHNPFAHSASDYPGPGDKAVDVEIPKGATGAQMGTVLQQADVVASVKAFTNAFAQNPAAAGIQPGTYALKTKMKASDAVAVLAKGEKVETNVTIPEGYTAAQVLDKIASVTKITKDQLSAAVANPGSIGLPAEAGGKVEGWLFPATYTVQPNDTATTLLKSMVAKTVAELDAQGVPAAQREDVLKTASIVEREAPANYFGQVAEVIANRLNRGDPLGMDAIDAYGLGIPSNQITSAQFNDTKLPYASRVHKGLPPTPIGNPGLKAIDAASHPTPGPWIWYVTVNLDTGETKFTDNYAEFQQFKSEYQTWAASKGKG